MIRERLFEGFALSRQLKGTEEIAAQMRAGEGPAVLLLSSKESRVKILFQKRVINSEMVVDLTLSFFLV